MGANLPFQTLYRRRQTTTSVLPLSWYVSDAEELSWVEKIQIKRSRALSKTKLRGLVVRHNLGFMPHNLVANQTIILATGLTREEERFVAIKELMHCYFGPDGGGIFATNTEINFENHMNEFFGNSAAIGSHQVKAEKQALWMAMSVLCTEQQRRDYRHDVHKNDKAIAAVASDLRVPERTAAAFLSNQYEREISEIVE